MPAFGDNPFAVLTLIAAPAVLTNASSVLALGTSNRFARAVDRARALAASIEKEDTEDEPLLMLRLRQLDRVEKRALLLLHALTSFYTSLGSFAAASLVSLLGASLTSSTNHLMFQIALGLALIAGLVGVGGLVFGCSLLVRETRLAVLNIAEESALVHTRFEPFLKSKLDLIDPG